MLFVVEYSTVTYSLQFVSKNQKEQKPDSFGFLDFFFLNLLANKKDQFRIYHDIPRQIIRKNFRVGLWW